MHPRFIPSHYGETQDQRKQDPLVMVVILGLGVLGLYTILNRATLPQRGRA